MIVSFSVSNFRSFSSEETFSLVASKRLASEHKDHELPIPNSSETVLKTGVLYGANGAGKSNLFRALRYLKSLAVQTREKTGNTGREKFRFAHSSELPSSFDIQFISKRKLYRFGIKVDDHRVIEEWLVRTEGGREKMVYERITDSNGRVAVEAGNIGDVSDKLKALITVGGRKNQSFLATIQANLEPDDVSRDIRNVLHWFFHSLVLIGPDESFAPVGHMLSDDDKFRDFASNFLKSSSTGVDNLDVIKKEITEDELYSFLPKSLVKKVLNDEDIEGPAVVDIGKGSEVLIERVGEEHFYLITIQASHASESGSVALELTDESDGTRRLLNLMPVLHHLRKEEDAIFFIDEIDRSMHPKLVWKFIEFFLSSCQEGGRQLIVTTHESNLLDLELLRRDEIWFVEKDDKAATRLYSLADFKVRSDLKIRKHYLQGRFGAVPFLGNIDRLLAKESNHCNEFN